MRLAFLSLLLATSQIRGADLMVAVGGSGNVHPTLTSALSAANPNDRILVQPGTYNENVTVTKSVEIVSNAQTQRYTVNGNFSFHPATNGTTATVIGMHLTGNVGDNAGGAANNSTLRLIDCRIGQLFSISNAVRYVLIADSVFGGIMFERGDVLGSWVKTGTANIAVNINGIYTYPEVTRVIGNIIVSEVGNTTSPVQMHARNPFRLENNFIQFGGASPAIQVNNASVAPTTTASQVVNNTVIRLGSGAWNLVGVLETDPFPVDARNNYSVGAGAPTFTSAGTGLSQGFNVHSTNTAQVNSANGMPTAGSPAINAGDPDVAYTDLDLSRNDAGCYGGSLTRDNCDDAVPMTAFISFVNAPRRTLAAGTVTFSADGIDR